ncbi:lipopolysaccharide biosynthesis protein [Microbacterium aurum]
MSSTMRRRLVGFMIPPALAAISPLVALPFVSRSAGPSGWASAIAGEAVGTFIAIVIGYGWAAVGPALVSVAATDAERVRLYRDSLLVRLAIAVIGLPVLGVLCWFIASPGAEWLTLLMGAQGALIALSFTWYCAGVGDPRTIIIYDAIPRVVATVLASVVIALTGAVVLYPIAGIVVTVAGTAMFTARLLHRHPGPWPTARELPALLRSGFPVALNDAALSAYSSVPAPLVNVTAPAVAAAGYASADKMFKLGSILPFTLASALQRWVGEVNGSDRADRLRVALMTHAALGLAGGVGLAALGSWVSLLLFGADATAPTNVLVAMGLVFVFLSLRTSMTRHILFPAGAARVVVRATLVASALGVPAMIVLALTIGPVGAAIGYALTEGAATILLWGPCAATFRDLRRESPSPRHPAESESLDES